jgi:hypothetical protein
MYTRVTEKRYIQLVGHLTLAAKAWIEQADLVLFAVAEPVTAKWLRTLNATAQALPYNTDNQLGAAGDEAVRSHLVGLRMIGRSRIRMIA